MAWYTLKFYRRDPGGPSVGRNEDSAVFEAVDDLVAKSEGYRWTRSLESGMFAVLNDQDDQHLGTYEPPDA